MSKAAPKKRPANAEAAALGAKKKVKTADVSRKALICAEHHAALATPTSVLQEVLVKVKILAKKVREDPVLSR